MADFEFRHRVFVGLCVAAHVPFAIALLILIPIAFFALSRNGDYSVMIAFNSLLVLFSAAYLIVMLFSGATAIVFGIPFVLLCRRFGCEFWWSFLVGGALAGVPVAMVFDYHFLLDFSLVVQGVAFQDLLFSKSSALGIVCGALSALTFWYMVYRRAPARRP